MKQYVVDAFTDKLFEGNPAAVCELDHWLPDELLLKIACENNLSETAFFVGSEGKYRLRWFTPGGEIDLCGHATLASAFVIVNFIDRGLQSVAFDTMSGTLTVTKKGDLFEMDFPAYQLTQVPVTDEMERAIGARPKAAYMGRDLLCVMESEEIVRGLTPDLDKVQELEGLLLQVTAEGTDFDCVSRTFAPKLNVMEDPVCGSGHCHIFPYWSMVKEKSSLKARQASGRGGTLYGRIEGDRVYISGNAVLFSESTLHIG